MLYGNFYNCNVVLLKGSKRGFKRESINRYPMSISTVCTMVHITLNVFVIKMQFMCWMTNVSTSCDIDNLKLYKRGFHRESIFSRLLFHDAKLSEYKQLTAFVKWKKNVSWLKHLNNSPHSAIWIENGYHMKIFYIYIIFLTWIKKKIIW